MTLVNNIKKMQMISTENGDAAYRTTCNANLDFFSTAAAARYNKQLVLRLFECALKENPAMAIKNALYLRDVRHGLGERDGFRLVYSILCRKHPEIACRMTESVVEVGRYDDLLWALDTPCEADVVDYLKKKLMDDMKKLEAGESVSLCAKWMPSINSGNQLVVDKAKKLAKGFGMRQENYRRMLSKLRADVLENKLRVKDYSFEYEHVPSKAMMKYSEAFLRNDTARYRQFLDDCAAGKKTLSSKTLFPYEIIRGYHERLSEEEKTQRELAWRNLPRESSSLNTIVVRDGSGSMTWFNGLPIQIATSLAILTSEMLSGEFKNKFITFSSNPELVELPEGTLLEKLKECEKYNDYTNTDLTKVFDLILRASSTPGFKKEDAVERILIISDMEFDRGVENVPVYETFKKKYEALGLPIPEVVFWNVCARAGHFAAQADDPNVRFVSGASNHVIAEIFNHQVPDALSLMQQTLERYSYVDDWFDDTLKIQIIGKKSR